MSVLREGWRECTLGETVEVKYGAAKPKTEGSVPAVGSGGIYAYVGEALVEGPTLVVGRKGTIGNAWLMEEPCWPSDTTFYLDQKSEAVTWRFLHCCLLHRPPSGEHSKTTIPSLKRGDLQEIALLLPPLEEQEAIAHALQGVQAAIQARRRELDLERERKAALLDHLFTYGTRGEATKETEIGEMPSTWRVVRLGDLVDVKGGKRLPKGSDYVDDPSATPYIRVTDFKDGSVDVGGVRYISSEVATAIKRYTINHEDVYLSIAGTIGLVGVVPPALTGANLTENAAKLVVRNAEEVGHLYLRRFLNTEPAQGQIRALTMKTSQPKLALMRIKEILVALPPLDEQQELEDVLAACDRKAVALEREIALHEELFQVLLEELMTGQRSALPLVTTN